MGTCGNFVGTRGNFVGTSWKLGESHGNLWELMGTCGKFKEFMELRENFVGT